MLKREKIKIILQIMIITSLLVSCGKEDYMSDMDINILDSFTMKSVIQTNVTEEYNLSNNNNDDKYIISETIDYHNEYLKYINETEGFGITESDILMIIDELSDKNLNEYEEYNLALLNFYINRHYEYDYGLEGNYDTGEAVFLDYGDSIEIDLNNDGINETLVITVSKEVDNTRMWQWNISINGADTDQCYIANNPAEQYAIVKIGNKNRIILSDYGRSNDDFALLLTWNGNTINNMCDKLKYSVNGNIKGLEAVLTPVRSGINITGDDKVIITAAHRLNKLQTWWTKINYILTGDFFEEITFEEGYYPTYFPVFLLEDITLYDEMDEESETLFMEKGQVVILTGTDDEKFLKVSNTYDETGWFLFDEVNVTDIFFGLAFYD